MQLSDLLERAGLGWGRASSVDQEITGIQFDSRDVQPGDLFVAIQGHKLDGHNFISDAIEKGAVAIIVEEEQAGVSPSIPQIVVKNGRTAVADLAASFYEDPTEHLYTVGVTGTKGKSSVCHMGAAVLGQERTALISTITNALLRGVEQTTPESATIQQLAREALDGGLQNLVVETSAHALAQERVRAVDFDVAVFTNLSHDHFDYFENWNEYLDAKLKLFKSLKQTAIAIVNIDDPMSDRILSSTSANVLTFSLHKEADLIAEIAELGPTGTIAKVKTPEGEIQLNLKLPGQFYVENALAVAGVGFAAGLDMGTIKSRLESVDHIEGRFERYQSAQGVAIVIDFAHSPDSLRRMLETLNGFYDRVITVFGCGGDSDRQKRPEMGRISGELSALTIVTNDNPKHEDPAEILREIERGLAQTSSSYRLIEDRREAIDVALASARPGEVVLIAGKGHEQKQSFDGFEIDYNDRDYLIQQGIIRARPESEVECTSLDA